MSGSTDPVAAAPSIKFKRPDEIIEELKVLKDSNSATYEADLGDLRRIVHQKPTMKAKFDHVTVRDAANILEALGEDSSFELIQTDLELGSKVRDIVADALEADRDSSGIIDRACTTEIDLLNETAIANALRPGKLPKI